MAQLTLRGDLSLLLLFARLLFLELQLFDYRFPREPMRLPTQPLGGWQVDVGEIIRTKPPHRARFVLAHGMHHPHRAFLLALLARCASNQLPRTNAKTDCRNLLIQ